MIKFRFFPIFYLLFICSFLISTYFPLGFARRNPHHQTPDPTVADSNALSAAGATTAKMIDGGVY